MTNPVREVDEVEYHGENINQVPQTTKVIDEALGLQRNDLIEQAIELDDEAAKVAHANLYGVGAHHLNDQWDQVAKGQDNQIKYHEPLR